MLFDVCYLTLPRCASNLRDRQRIEVRLTGSNYVMYVAAPTTVVAGALRFGQAREKTEHSGRSD